MEMDSLKLVALLALTTVFVLSNKDRLIVHQDQTKDDQGVGRTRTWIKIKMKNPAGEKERTSKSDSNITWCKGPPRLLNFSSSWPWPVALTSSPGSGNTWLRLLLQQLTGVATGSIYLDRSLKANNIFTAEGIQNGSVLVVKTHKHTREEIQRYGKAILLIRNPFDSIKAEFNRWRSGGNHTGLVTYHDIVTHPKLWEGIVKLGIKSWKFHHRRWLQSKCGVRSDDRRSKGGGGGGGGGGGPLLVVRYEDLLQQPQRTLSEVLAFLGFDPAAVTPDEWRCALNPDATDRFKRWQESSDSSAPPPPNPFELLDGGTRRGVRDEWGLVQHCLRHGRWPWRPGRWIMRAFRWRRWKFWFSGFFAREEAHDDMKSEFDKRMNDLR